MTFPPTHPFVLQGMLSSNLHHEQEVWVGNKVVNPHVKQTASAVSCAGAQQLAGSTCSGASLRLPGTLCTCWQASRPLPSEDRPQPCPPKTKFVSSHTRRPTTA